jgi:hypothetical protein
MSSKQGFGNIADVVNSTTNCSIVIQLAPHGTKRIFDITAGYNLRTGGTATLLSGGRLIIVGIKFDAPTSFINPRDFELPTVTGNIYFDAPIIPDGNNKAVVRSFNWINGLVLPDSQDASIILTACFADAPAPPAAGDVNAYLSVSGLVAGADKIFKNV